MVRNQFTKVELRNRIVVVVQDFRKRRLEWAANSIDDLPPELTLDAEVDALCDAFSAFLTQMMIASVEDLTAHTKTFPSVPVMEQEVK